MLFQKIIIFILFSLLLLGVFFLHIDSTLVTSFVLSEKAILLFYLPLWKDAVCVFSCPKLLGYLNSELVFGNWTLSRQLIKSF